MEVIKKNERIDLLLVDASRTRDEMVAKDREIQRLRRLAGEPDP